MFRVLLYDSDGCNSKAGVCDARPPPTSPPPLVFTPVGFPFYQYTVDHKRTSGATRENVGRKKENDVVIIGSTT